MLCLDYGKSDIYTYSAMCSFLYIFSFRIFISFTKLSKSYQSFGRTSTFPEPRKKVLEGIITFYTIFHE